MDEREEICLVPSLVILPVRKREENQRYIFDVAPARNPINQDLARHVASAAPVNARNSGHESALLER